MYSIICIKRVNLFNFYLKNEITPIEVKSGDNINSASLRVYNELNKPKTRVRFSMKNLSRDDNLINIPLFMVEYLDKFFEILE